MPPQGDTEANLDSLARSGPPSAEAKFLSLASHDLRGALANVRSWTGLLSSKSQLDAKGIRALEVITRNTDRALSLVQAIFDVLRMETGSLPTYPEPVAVEKELMQAASRAQQRGLALSVDIANGLPEPQWDVSRFQAALEALFEHARSRARSRAHFQAMREGAGISFSVEDDGEVPGPTALANTFRPDAQALAEEKLGPGFMLAASAQFVTASGGRVQAEALPQGARYGFWLPVAPLDA